MLHGLKLKLCSTLLLVCSDLSSAWLPQCSSQAPFQGPGILHSWLIASDILPVPTRGSTAPWGNQILGFS